AGIFAIDVVAVGRLRGVMALVALAISFLVLYFFVLPAILQGSNPLVVAVVGPDLGVADAYATAAVAMGGPGLIWLDGLPSPWQHAVVTEDAHQHHSRTLPTLPA
ncbi:YibE/F family protein, partial [Micromonospora chalcea]